MSDRDRQRLLNVQIAVKDLEEAKNALQELERRTISSPNMDGMPHGPAQGDAMAAFLLQKEYAQKKLNSARKVLDEARRKAQKVCNKISNRHMRKFCEAYYVEGFPFEVAQALSGVQDRQCYSYITIVKDKTSKTAGNCS